MPNDKPWWWPLVVSAGLNPDQWEPVKEKERTKPGEKILSSLGWVDTTDYDSHFSYTSRHPPRIRRKKAKMVKWRLCVYLEYWHESSEEMDKQLGIQPRDRFRRARLQWIESGSIKAPWCPLKSQTQPFETVKKLPEGKEP